MKFRYFGHSAFAFEDGEHCVLFDPFLSGNPLMGSIPSDLKPTTIILTHGHEDHVGDTVDIAKEDKIPVVAVFELATHLGNEGLETIPCGLGGRVDHAWGWSKFVPAFHSSSFGGKYMGMPAGCIIDFAGKRIYNAGDTCVFGDMKLIAEMYKPEIALLPIGGHFTMDLFEAVKAVELISPKVVIPIHYNTWEPIAEDAAKFKSEVESKTSARVQVVEPKSVWDCATASV